MRYQNINDDNLYHFTRSEIAYECILNEKQLQFGSLLRTNDPLEFTLYKHDVDCSLYDAFSNEVDDAYEFTDEISLHVQKKYKLLCFSTDNVNTDQKEFVKGYQKPRMWAQYGENHNGCCLVFSKSKICNVLNKIKEEDKCKIYNGKINYTNDMQTLRKNRIISTLERNCNVQNIIDKRVDSYFFNKYEDFRDEEEHRFVLFSERFEEQDNFKFNYMDSLLAVILGARLNNNYREIITDHCRIESVSVYKMDWTNSVPMISTVK